MCGSSTEIISRPSYILKTARSLNMALESQTLSQYCQCPSDGPIKHIALLSRTNRWTKGRLIEGRQHSGSIMSLMSQTSGALAARSALTETDP